MQPGQVMNGEELQSAAREAIEGRTQEEVAERLGVSRSTVAVALNHDDADRYQKTLAAIIEAFAGYSIRRQVRYTVEDQTPSS